MLVLSQTTRAQEAHPYRLSPSIRHPGISEEPEVLLGPSRTRHPQRQNPSRHTHVLVLAGMDQFHQALDNLCFVKPLQGKKGKRKPLFVITEFKPRGSSSSFA